MTLETNRSSGTATILVVDNNRASVAILFEFLENNGFRVLVARDGESAVRRAQLAQPDLILLDVLMPGVDGLEACRQMKADPLTREIPVIFMTGLSETQDKLRGFEAGGVDYLVKPLQLTEVLARVTTHLRLRRVVADLKTANRDLETFIYSVSHDLRAPLRAISGYCGAVEEDYADLLPEAGQKYLRQIGANAARMSQLIDDLLIFSRFSRQPLQKITVVPAELIAQAQEELRPETQDREIRVMVGKLPECQADPSLLKQVWVNLLSNAYKYTRKRPLAEIEIGCLPVQGKPGTTYYIKDNGVGFDMAQADRLFGVFQRLHTQQEFEGTGVGLAIVQRIIQRHGGKIWAEAQVDQGATFYFTIG